MNLADDEDTRDEDYWRTVDLLADRFNEGIAQWDVNHDNVESFIKENYHGVVYSLQRDYGRDIGDLLFPDIAYYAEEKRG